MNEDSFNTLIVCLTILILILGFTFLMTNHYSNQSPYKVCMNDCKVALSEDSNEIECFKECNTILNCMEVKNENDRN